MSTSVLACPSSRAQVRAKVLDYLELTKPRIAVLELVTVAVAACLASWGPPEALPLVGVMLGTAMVAASASAGNQWIEHQIDARMSRTADRPLPAGRLSRGQVALFGAATLTAGLVVLVAMVNWLTAALALLTWLLYVVVYTPLKTRTPLNTVVGAVAGALPILLGWTATGTPLDLTALSLFLIVFLWQFPHFMAIAWIYREQYAEAGMRMLSVVDPSGRRAGVQAAITALVLVPVSLLPAMAVATGPAYLAVALVLGIAQLACATAFLCRTNETIARLLLRMSLVYLPSILVVLLLTPFF